jgi:hypothetical protein
MERGRAYRHALMPQIEAAHLGPLPKAAFKQAVLVCSRDERLHRLRIQDFDPLAYEAMMQECRASARN